MCKVLKVSRAPVYYVPKEQDDSEIRNHIIQIFYESRNNYGTRKIKVKLVELGYQVSRRRIGRIMKEEGLVSNYTVKQFKVHKTTCNEENVDNVVNREFTREEQLDVVVSDLTYVNVAGKWNYVCFILDLFNREIIGYSCGKYKNAELVYRAICKVPHDLNKIHIFHTDRGNEFKNKLIDEVAIFDESNIHKIYFFYTRCNLKINEFIIQKEELSEVMWFDIDKVIDMIKDHSEQIVYKENRIDLFKKLKDIYF